MGDSAGGNIVHHVGVMAAEAAADLKPLSISGLMLLEVVFTPCFCNLLQFILMDSLANIKSCGNLCSPSLVERRGHPPNSSL